MAAACSIIIPVHDDRGFLADALASVLAQTVVEWEAIVVDDGSAHDAAARAVAERGDHRIRLVAHDVNRGLAAARNTGIRAALTELVVTLDADDMLAPTYLERVLPHLSGESDANCVYTDFETFGARTGRIRWPPGDPASLLRFQHIPGPGAAYRRALWEATGGYWEDPALRIGNEDREFWISALEIGLRPVHIPEPLYRYRVGHASMMSRLDPQVYTTHRAIVDRHPAIYRRHHAAGAFLADGYVTSARAVRERGQRREAISLAMRALRHDPMRGAALGVIGRSLMPEPIHRGLRAMRRRVGGDPA